MELTPKTKGMENNEERKVHFAKEKAELRKYIAEEICITVEYPAERSAKLRWVRHSNY